MFVTAIKDMRAAAAAAAAATIKCDPDTL